MKIAPEIQKIIRETRQTVMESIAKLVKPGDIVVWKKGPSSHFGRKALVQSVHWDEHEMMIFIFVRTWRHDGMGFLSVNNPIDLQGHDLDKFLVLKLNNARPIGETENAKKD